MSPQPNPIRQTNIPGLAIGDYSSAAPVPSPSGAPVGDVSGSTPPSGTTALEAIRESPANLADPRWGLHLDGVTDDSSALAAVFAGGPRSVFLPDGKSLAFASTLTLGIGQFLRMGANSRLVCGVTGGADGIVLKDGGRIEGPGAVNSGSNAVITTTATAVVGNLLNLGGGAAATEYAYVKGVTVIPTTGATVAANIKIIGVFGGGEPRLNGVVSNANGIATNNLVINDFTGRGTGQFGIVGCWFEGAVQHLVVIDTVNGSSIFEIWFDKCLFQDWTTGFDGIRIGATGAVYGVHVSNSHFERSTADTAATNIINLIRGIATRIENLHLSVDQAPTGGGSETFVNIGASTTNQGTVVDQLNSYSRNVTLLNDNRSTNTLTGQYLDSYRQGQTGTQGDAPRSVSAPIAGWIAPTYSASITPSAVAGRWQTITVTNTTAFTINAPTNPPTSKETQELVIEVLNSSGGTMGAITWNAAYIFGGFVWANPATGKHRYAHFEWNGANWICTSIATADY